MSPIVSHSRKKKSVFFPSAIGNNNVNSFSVFLIMPWATLFSKYSMFDVFSEPGSMLCCHLKSLSTSDMHGEKKDRRQREKRRWKREGVRESEVEGQ